MAGITLVVGDAGVATMTTIFMRVGRNAITLRDRLRRRQLVRHDEVNHSREEEPMAILASILGLDVSHVTLPDTNGTVKVWPAVITASSVFLTGRENFALVAFCAGL